MSQSPSGSISELAGDAKIFSFVVRVWREELSSEKHKETWRGHITPIPDGERHYFLDINDIPSLIYAQLRSQR